MHFALIGIRAAPECTMFIYKTGFRKNNDNPYEEHVFAIPDIWSMEDNDEDFEERIRNNARLNVFKFEDVNTILSAFGLSDDLKDKTLFQAIELDFYFEYLFKGSSNTRNNIKALFPQIQLWNKPWIILQKNHLRRIFDLLQGWRNNTFDQIYHYYQEFKLQQRNQINLNCVSIFILLDLFTSNSDARFTVLEADVKYLETHNNTDTVVRTRKTTTLFESCMKRATIAYNLLYQMRRGNIINEPESPLNKLYDSFLQTLKNYQIVEGTAEAPLEPIQTVSDDED